MTSCQNTSRDPQGKKVEIDGILYQIIDGKLYRYADLTLDKGFKIVLGRPGSEEILKNLLNRLVCLHIAVTICGDILVATPLASIKRPVSEIQKTDDIQWLKIVVPVPLKLLFPEDTFLAYLACSSYVRRCQ